jgi:hypothetical protein
MSDPTFNSVTVRQATAGSVGDLLTLDAVDAADGNGAALRFVDNSSGALSFALGRVGARRVDASTVRLELGVAGDPSVSSSGDTPTLLSLEKGAAAPKVITAAGSALEAGGPLSVAGPTTLSGSLSVAGPTALSGALSVAGAMTLSSSLSVNGNLSLGGRITGDLRVDGQLFWGNGAFLRNDQGGAIELGNSLLSGTRPYIDFHFGVGAQQDYNVRLINNADRELWLANGSLRVVQGGVTVAQNLRVEGDYEWPSPRNFLMQSNGPGEWSFDFQNNHQGSMWSVWGPAVGSVLTVRNNGRVGVNYTDPHDPLHVNGPVKVGGTGSDYLRLEAGAGNTDRATIRFDTHYLSLWNPNVGDFVVFNGYKRTKIFGIPINLDGQVEFRRGVLVSGGGVTVSGDLYVGGTLNASKKNGFVVDQFVNTLGEALEAGDVVVVGERQEALYYAEGSGIPVPEVDLARGAYDSRVCGIVVEAFAPGPPDTLGAASEEPEGEPVVVDSVAELLGPDRSSVQPGQIGLMATLGAFARCKVDADIAPIRPGDLLTTSPTPGHAQKVLDRGQAVGAILGKALGGLEGGKGVIPVMVLLM